MNEETLIQSEHYNIKKIIRPILLALLVLALLIPLIEMLSWGISFGRYIDFDYGGITILICFSIAAGLALILLLIYTWLRSYELVVTDKRIYGRVAFGSRVDLPLDSVSAISMISFLNGVTVATSSGRISFLLVKNAYEIYSVMNQLLLERQRANRAEYIAQSVPVSSSNAEELKKYKELLDMGVITQEEFDTKKKQLLGL